MTAKHDVSREGVAVDIGTAPRRIGYVPELDGLRGLGAVLVVTVHYFMLLVSSPGLPSQVPGTFIWMDMFFVLSGFLITALLLKEQNDTGRVAIWPFYRRRALRLLPALYALLLVHIAYARIVGLDAKVQRESIILAATYVLNWRMDNILTARVSEGLTQLWSLAVEEQFYLVWPWVVALLLPLRRRLATVTATLTALVVVIATRRLIMFEDGTNWFRLYTHTDTRADSLLIGALLGYWWVHGRTPVRFVKGLAWVASAFVAWCVFAVELDDPFAYRGGFTLLAVAFAVIVLASVDTDWPLRRVLSARPMRAVGRVSYGIYLWHVLVQLVVSRIGGTWSTPARFSVATALIVVTTLASWYLVEKPALRWKDRLEARPDRDRQPGVRGPAPEPAVADAPP